MTRKTTVPELYMFLWRLWVFLNLWFRFGELLHQAYNFQLGKGTFLCLEFVFDGIDYSASAPSGFWCLLQAIWTASGEEEEE